MGEFSPLLQRALRWVLGIYLGSWIVALSPLSSPTFLLTKAVWLITPLAFVAIVVILSTHRQTCISALSLLLFSLANFAAVADLLLRGSEAFSLNSPVYGTFISTAFVMPLCAVLLGVWMESRAVSKPAP